MKTRIAALLAAACFAFPAHADWADAVDAYNKGDYATAAKEFRPFADSGQATAQYILGWIYQSGEGVTQDYAEAAKWYQRAAEKGNVDAQYALGALHMAGNGVGRDDAKAAEWFRKAGEQGKAPAQYLLGYLLARGEGVAKNEAEAAIWYRKAADQGYVDAQYAYALALGTGTGIAKDDGESNAWLTKAAEQGHVESAYLLGWNFEKGVGALPDYTQAAKWFQKAADGGNLEANYHLAMLTRDGRGVDRDEAKALALFSKAAAQGQPSTPVAIDDYIKAGRPDLAFTLADVWLAKSPDDVQLATLVAFTAINEARTDPTKYAALARTYGDKSIALMEGDKRPASMPAAEWTEYRDRWLPQLYQRLGALAQKTGTTDEARKRLERATAIAPKDPYGWYLLGQTQFSEYEKLNAAAKPLEGAAKSEAVGKAFAKLDQVIDAYARAVGLTTGNESARDLHDPLLKDLTGLYEFRNGTKKGLDDVIGKYRPK